MSFHNYHQTVVEIDFPSGTQGFSFRGLRSASGGIFPPLLMEAGMVTRSIGTLPSPYRPTDLTVRLRDRERRFSTLKHTDSFYNMPMRIRRATSADPAVGGTLTTVAEGLIGDWELSQGNMALAAKDAIYSKLSLPIDTTLKVLDRATFPNLPIETEPRLVPFAIGFNFSRPDVSAPFFVGPGQCPCYLIDPAIGQPKYRYVVCQNPVNKLDAIYSYKTFIGATGGMPAGCALTTAVYGGTTMTVLDFDTDQRDPDRPREIEISVDVTGEWPTTGLTGNPAEQCKRFLQTIAPISGTSIDTAGFATAVTAALVRTYDSAFVLLDRKMNYVDVLNLFQQSFFMPIYLNRQGQITCFVVTETVGTPTTNFREQFEILKETFRAKPTGNPIGTQVRLAYNRHWSRNFSQYETTVTINGERPRLGLSAELPRDFESPMAIDAPTATSVAKAIAPFIRESTHLIECELEPGQLEEAELNTWAAITHRDGISLSGGYNARPMRVIESNFYPSIGQSRLAMKAVAIEDGIVFA